MMKKTVFAIFLLTITLTSISQTSVRLSEDESKLITSTIKDKVKGFQNAIAVAALSGISHDVKVGKRDATLADFIGNGDPYDYKNPSNEKIEKHEAVKIITRTSKHRKDETKEEFIKGYLNRLIRNSEDPNFKYEKVVITSAKALRIGTLEKIGPNKYVTTASWLQKYEGIRNGDVRGKGDYYDYTGKQIIIYIDALEVYDADGNLLTTYIVKLGDVNSDYVY